MASRKETSEMKGVGEGQQIKGLQEKNLHSDIGRSGEREKGIGANEHGQALRGEKELGKEKLGEKELGKEMLGEKELGKEKLGENSYKQTSG